MTNKNTNITININTDKAITLSIDEAKLVHEELCRLFSTNDLNIPNNIHDHLRIHYTNCVDSVL